MGQGLAIGRLADRDPHFKGCDTGGTEQLGSAARDVRRILPGRGRCLRADDQAACGAGALPGGRAFARVQRLENADDTRRGREGDPLVALRHVKERETDKLHDEQGGRDDEDCLTGEGTRPNPAKQGERIEGHSRTTSALNM